jgi:hypothetical protein
VVDAFVSVAHQWATNYTQQSQARLTSLEKTVSHVRTAYRGHTL